ncbi:MBL fold metallo-hydrolase [Candidatus Pacearchaeota archaeon]|nr:MBL fold metallo-hydrolase [Candidatus Pacearchaeota archaeon]MBD3283546.1 MBL fold metallo-hydrolase [Candidatus Pacearchaeota archaeon]
MKYKNIEISWLGHASFMIKSETGKVIYLDPFKIKEDSEKADFVLLTHSHYDHCSIEDIKKIIKPSTVFVGPADIQSKLGKVGDGINLEITEPGKTIEADEMKISAVPAYNSNKEFHPRENNWLGYVVDLGVKVYHAGDSDLISEMNNIYCDVALLPVGGKFTMDWREAAKAAGIIKPKLAVPMHFGEIIGDEKDAEKFISECSNLGVNSEILDKV